MKKTIETEKIKEIKEQYLRFIKKYFVYFSIVLLLIIGFIYNKNKADIFNKKLLKENPQKALEDKIYFNSILYDKTLAEKRKILLQPFEDEYVVGDKNAPIIIIDFSSFTCTYCSKMREPLNRILDEYIPKKQVKYIFRPFLSKKTIVLKRFLDCIQDTEIKHKVRENIFKTNWNKYETLREVLAHEIAVNNLNTKEIIECADNEESFVKMVYLQRENVLVFDVAKTPLLVINGKKYYGYKTYNELKTIIESHVPKNK